MPEGLDWAGRFIDHAETVGLFLKTWLPLALSTIATVVSVLAYRRSGPPTLPKVWATLSSRGPAGFIIKLTVENHTGSTVRLTSARVHGFKVGANEREIPSNRKPWETPKGYEYDWVDSLPLSSELAPGETFSEMIRVASSCSSHHINASLFLSISTMRRTIKSKVIVVPIMIPPMS